MKKRVIQLLGLVLLASFAAMAGHRANGEKDMSSIAAERKHTNRLINETSPYLLQHADNPVDWYPWCAEAFEAAKKLDKPIFLSIGYSTCHWCHVMAYESFSSERIARIMNKHFISIKVDREQRPDVDAVYMNAVQMMTGSGGWPLSVFLTPDGKPFYGGTYYPPEDRFGRSGFEKILLAIADAWENRRDQLVESAGKMTGLLAAEKTSAAHKSLSPEMIERAAAYFARTFDSRNGGFGMAPKFPQPSNLTMLMTHWRRTGDANVLKMVTTTLDAMAEGGIHDHLGGGFHRYSVDAVWLVPHFEKMLYDQALLSRAYLQAWQITGNENYGEVARDILDYVLRDMADPAGGFYSAEDADSEGVEGTFYVWTPKQINDLLDKDQAKIFSDYYGVTKKGNFGEGKTILSVKMSVEELAKKHDISPAKARQVLQAAGSTLFNARAKRPRPHRDEKIIAGWNGLMISALAMGGRILAEDKYTTAAHRSAEFVLTRLRTNGRLNRFYGKGKPVGLAFADDYAFMMMGLLDLYETDFKPRWLVEAKALADGMIELFADKDKGGLFMTGVDNEELIVRTKPSYDGAVPNANSVAARALLRLGQLTMQPDYTGHGKRVLDAFSSQLADSGASLAEMLLAVDYYIGPRQEIVIAGRLDADDTERMLRFIAGRFMPTAVTMLHAAGGAGREIEAIVPFIENQTALNGTATAYVCENYICNQPVNSIDELKKILAKVEKPFKENKNAADSTVDK